MGVYLNGSLRIMKFEDLVTSMTPTIYENIKRAVELGKWPNGLKLTDEQRNTCMQAIIAYDNKNTKREEQTGYIYNTKKKVSNFDQLDAQSKDDTQIIDFK